MSAHTCHAIGCVVPVPRRLLMCLRHWKLVPPGTRRLVLATYRAGQEQGRVRVTGEYLEAARSAINLVATREGLL